MSRETFNFINEKSNFRVRAAKVWMAIYTLMTRKQFKPVSPSLEILCQMTSQSQSTVQRGLRELLKKKYLFYCPMNNKKWSVNVYKCLIPGKSVPEYSSNKGYKQDREPYEQFFVKKDSWDDILSWNAEYQKMRYRDPNQTSNQSFHPSCRHYSTKNEVSLPKVDHHHNNKDIYINKHNIGCEILNSVVRKNDQSCENEISEMEGEINSLQIKIPELEKEINYVQLLISDNVIDRFRLKDAKLGVKLLEKINSLGSEKLHMETRRDYLARNREEKIKIMEQRDCVSQDETYLAEKCGRGKRMISKGLMWWIKKKLFSFGVAKSQMALKINEVVHAVRFGALSHMKYQIHHEMPIMKSINIALKLIKEGKWQSPFSFKYGEAVYE